MSMRAALPTHLVHSAQVVCGIVVAIRCLFKVEAGRGEVDGRALAMEVQYACGRGVRERQGTASPMLSLQHTIGLLQAHARNWGKGARLLQQGQEHQTRTGQCPHAHPGR